MAGNRADVTFVRRRPLTQWPAPIALFVLALVIGTVYYRTGSLIAAIFMHATFNGISTFMLFMRGAGRVRIIEPDKSP